MREHPGDCKRRHVQRISDQGAGYAVETMSEEPERGADMARCAGRLDRAEPLWVCAASKVQPRAQSHRRRAGIFFDPQLPEKVVRFADLPGVAGIVLFLS